MLRVLIVDDEPLARARLQSLIERDCQELASVQDVAPNAVRAMECLLHQPIDVVLLDIGLPGLSGLDFAKKMNELATRPAFIFVSAHAEHAVQAFELDATDYLTKPVRPERLRNSLQRAIRLRNIRHPSHATGQNAMESSQLTIHERGRVDLVPLSEVIYFKAELKYITVRTATRNLIMEGSLNELEERYEGAFTRIHRNSLVSCRRMRAIEKHLGQGDEGWVVRLDGVSERLAVSRRHLTAARQLLQQ